MLLWFVDHEVANAGIGGKRLIGKEEVETRPERVSASCLEENMCIRSIRKCFTPDAGLWCNETKCSLVLWLMH